MKTSWYKTWWIWVAILFVIGLFFNNDDTKNISVNDESGSSKSQIECGWCGSSFSKGTGYSTIMRVINTPESPYSHYCSRSCAEAFLMN